MNLMPLANRIDALRMAKLGVDLFLQQLPQEAEEGVLLRSPLIGTKINHELPGYYKSTFQLIVRGHDVEVISARTARIVKAITFIAETKLGAQTFKYCRPDHLPSIFPLSEGNLLEASVTFDVCWAE